MNTHEAIKSAMAMPDMVWRAYIDDLSDEDLMVRPLEGANHIKWQMGHLIAAEHSLIEAVCPGKMPDLPDGFAEKYTKETASSDNPDDFHTKQELLDVFATQRAGTLAALDSLAEGELDQPMPEKYQMFGPTIGSMFTMQPAHWTMHAGQWAIIRRKLGHAPLF